MVLWFILGEGACVTGSILLLWNGYEMLALACLLGPFQMIAFAFLMRSDLYLLAFLCGLLPFTALGMLPISYVHFVLLPSVFGLLLIGRLARTWVLEPGSARWSLPPNTRFPLVALGLLAGISHVAAIVRGRPVSSWTYAALTFYFLLAVWFFATTPDSMRQVRLLLYSMVPGYAAVCLLLFFFAPGVQGGLMGKTLVTPFSVVNMNSLAAHVGVFAAVALGAMLDEKRVGRKSVLLVVVFLLLAALLFTKSRGAWLGFGIAFLYFLLRTRSLLLLLLALGGAVSMYSMDFLRMSFISRVQATGAADPSLLGRFLLWKYAWIVFKDNWLIGVGMQNYRLVKFMYGFPWPRAFGLPYNSHNLFLEFMTNLGVFGLASLLWLKLGVFLPLDRTARRATHGRGMAIGLNAGLIVYVIHGLLDCIIWHHGAFILLGLILGLAVAVHRARSSPGNPRRKLPGGASSSNPDAPQSPLSGRLTRAS